MFSIISPLTAKYIQELISFLLNGEPLPIDIPDPTVYTAYEQYISDLYEIIFTVTLFVGVSIFIRDKTKDLLPLIFSKPINRTKYVISKYISFLALIFVSLTLGYLSFSYYTYFLFEEVFFVKGIWMMLLYFLDIMFVSAVALFGATYFKTYIPAMLVTWGIYIISGLVTIAAFVSPYKKDSENIKSIVKDVNFVEVFINTSVEECERRDVKGLYKKARAGEIKNMTGISAPYEAPENPDIEIKTEEETIEHAVQRIVDYINNKLKLDQ